MAEKPYDSADREPDTVATPEGDGEFALGEPLAPGVVELSVEGLQTPRGGAPAAYDTDRHQPTGLEKAIDEISHGKLLP
jgi:hypothetical protein